ncbi:putative plant UBX domain-containing protein 14 [Zingiber officinale]|uniref:UBX domain-containing protein n=1 Tax=Zingiber officinale TaxID=94328 RepID=A0A8J5FL97_ZINOF|nr:putative plant UBX domain-containing protein 14 [Zingiber officinale]KAG6483084.1 hypothetical protein ZIOFF_059724 [Zingiber officinale]
MEFLPSMEEQQLLVSSFLQIVVGQTTAIATQFLQATRWNLHDAIRLFAHVKDGGGVSSPSMPPPINGNFRLQSDQVLASCNSDLVSRRAAWESKESVPSTANASHDKLSSLPLDLIRQGISDQGFLLFGPKANHSSLCQKRRRPFDSTLLNIQDPSKRLRQLEDEPNLDKNGGAFSSGYPILPEEPQDTKEVCRIRIRLPDDGHFIQRNFFRADSTKLLWSFCSLHLEDGQKRGFHFTQVIPGASKTLTYHSNLTFEEAGLSNWLITLVWD